MFKVEIGTKNDDSKYKEQIEELKNEVKKAEKDGDEAKSKDIMSKIIRVQLARFHNTITLWKTAIDNFEDVQFPTNDDLITVYNDAVLDAHLTALMTNRKETTSGSDFKIVDENKEEIEDETTLFCSEWFKDCMNYALDSKFYGYSLIEFGDRKGKDFEKVSIVPREYVYQQKGIVRDTLNSDTGMSWSKPPFVAWHLGAGRDDDFGLLGKAAPLTIYKKAALGSWGDFSELFGSPLRIGRTRVKDEKLRNNMYEMLENMTSSSYGVFDHEDTIEFIQAAQSDAYEVFDKQIERMNSELSKLILGSTMTTDDGSSRSQSEVHEKTTNKLIKSDGVFLEYWINKKLIPFLNTYHNFGITGRFMFDDTEVLTMEQQFERDMKLAEVYNVPAEYIREKYGVPVEEKTESEPNNDPPPTEGKKKDKEIDNEFEPLGGAGVGKSLTSKSELNSFTAIIDNYYHVCCATELPEVPPEVLEGYEALKSDVLFDIYEGTTTPDDLPVNLHIYTGSALTVGIDEGLTEAQKLGFGSIRDEKMFAALADNAFKFSAAKTFQEVVEMSNFLVDENGEKRTFAAFKKEAGKVFDNYNKNYLRTEYDNAFNGSQMASKWADIEAEKDDFPFLKYITAGDGRVRKDHKELDGLVLPVNSDYWDKYYPPNGWNCRCDVQRKGDHFEDKVTKDSKIKRPDLDANFDNNVGKTKLLFTPEHPYFIVQDQYSKLKENNFNLPTFQQLAPKPAKVEQIAFEGYSGKWTRGSLKGNRLKMQEEYEKVLGMKVPDELFYNLDENTYINHLSKAKSKKGNGAHYSPSSKHIDFNPYNDRFAGLERSLVVAHEMGHAAHIANGQIDFGKTSPEFIKLMDSMKDELKAIAKKNGRRASVGTGASIIAADLRKLANSAFDARMKAKTPEGKQKQKDRAELITSVADSLEAITKGAYGWGHGKKYMTTANMAHMELYAHFSENYFIGNNVFNAYLPETYKKGNEYIKKQVENGRNNQ